MGSMIWGPDTIEFDLIDDAHADTITFHNPLGDELDRQRIYGRIAVNYRWRGPEPCHVHAKAWRSNFHLATLAIRKLYPGDEYRVDFGEPRAKPELTDEWRVSWVQDVSSSPPFWPEHTESKIQYFGALEESARQFAAWLRAADGATEVTLERRPVGPWTQAP